MWFGFLYVCFVFHLTAKDLLLNLLSSLQLTHVTLKIKSHSYWLELFLLQEMKALKMAQAERTVVKYWLMKLKSPGVT